MVKSHTPTTQFPYKYSIPTKHKNFSQTYKSLLDFPTPQRYPPHPIGRKEVNEMDQKENIKEGIENAVSLLIMLENDLSSQHSDEIHLRAVKIIHEILKAVLKELPE